MLLTVWGCFFLHFSVGGGRGGGDFKQNNRSLGYILIYDECFYKLIALALNQLLLNP